MVADCSACTLTMSLPALMKSATLCSGSTIILHMMYAVNDTAVYPHEISGRAALLAKICAVAQEVSCLGRCTKAIKRHYQR